MQPQDDRTQESMLVCVEDACSWQQFIPATLGEHGKPAKQCTVTVGYPQDSPHLPWLQFGAGDCAANAEIAMAFALTALLRLSGPATPVPKPHK